MITPHQNRLSKAMLRLKASGLKLTEARRRVLTTLIEHHGPFKMEELHSLLGKKDFDLVTLYRVLGTFESAGLVQKFLFKDRATGYEFADPDHHHHHVVCRVCHRMDEISDCPFEAAEASLKRLGYSETEHAATFYGVCRTCAEAGAGAS